MKLRMKEIRVRKGLGQKEVAAALGIPVRRYGSYEREERTLSLRDAALIADVFDCTLDELAGRDFRAGAPYADPRQAELNQCWAEADGARRDTILSVARLSAGRAGADQADPGADKGPVRPGMTEGVA